MQTKPRKTRDRREQLLTLLNGWDPAGVLEAGGSRDEYDSMIDALLGLLSQSSSKEEVTRFLNEQVREHFGVSAPDSSRFATKAIAWYAMASRE